MDKYDFWKNWKNKTLQEKEYIKKVKLAREKIISAIPKTKLVSIYVKGSFPRREIRKGSDIDIVPIVKEDKYQGRAFGANCKEVSPAIIVPLSIPELKDNKLHTKANHSPDLRAEPDRFLKKLNKYGLIYGKALDAKNYPIRSDKKTLRDEIKKIRNGYIPAYEKSNISLDPLIKEVFWLVELEQNVKGTEPEHSFKGIRNSIKDRSHIIHQAYKLKISRKRSNKDISLFIKDLKKHLANIK